MRRAYAVALACLASTAASADVPVPAPNPFVGGPEAVDTGCPEGSVPIAVAMGLVEMQSRESGEVAAVIADKLVDSMRAALSSVTKKPVVEVTSIVVLPLPNPGGAKGQMWVMISGACSPIVVILPPDVVSAVWKQIIETI